MKNNYKYVGKHQKRSDAREIVTGKAEYIDDICLNNLLFGRMLLSPYAHAIITEIDISKASLLRGVKAVLTYQNSPEWYSGLPLHRRILDSKVRCVGDIVALVAAVSEEVAEKALKLIEVSYEVLPHYLTPEESIEEDAILLYPQFKNNKFEQGCPMFSKEPFYHVKRGNIETGFKQSAFVSQGEYRYCNTPLPLAPEPPGVIAGWDDENNLTIWASSGSPYLFKTVLEESIPNTSIRVIGIRTGGSYGNKQLMVSIAFYAAALAKVTHKKVKLILNKYEQMLTWERRLGSYIKGKIGLTDDGIINAVSGEWTVDPGFTSTLSQGQLAVGLGEAQVMMAKCGNWDLEGNVVATNRPPGGPVRGFGGLELKCALFPLLFSAMKAGDFDPVEIYKKNFAQKGDRYVWRDGKLWTCKDVDYTQAIDMAANKFCWTEKWKGWHVQTRTLGNKAFGVGVAVHGNADVGEDRSEAYCRLDGHGNVTISCCIGDTGSGQRHAVQKMVAELLNISMKKVRITDADTISTPFDFGLVGSRGTLAIGSACLNAAQDAKEKLLTKASKMLGVLKDDLINEENIVSHKYNKSIQLPWIAITEGPEITISGIGEFTGSFSRPNFVIYFVEVAVNLMTGITEVINILIGTDVGQIIDPINLKMQLEGSIGAGCLDSAIYEECIVDTKTGKILNGNMIDYKWRTFNNMPNIETVILESQFDTHQYRAIGVGEISGAPAPAAMLMAISNAVETDITQYPVTPEIILSVLEKKAGK